MFGSKANVKIRWSPLLNFHYPNSLDMLIKQKSKIFNKCNFNFVKYLSAIIMLVKTPKLVQKLTVTITSIRHFIRLRLHPAQILRRRSFELHAVVRTVISVTDVTSVIFGRRHSVHICHVHVDWLRDNYTKKDMLLVLLRTQRQIIVKQKPL